MTSVASSPVGLRAATTQSGLLLVGLVALFVTLWLTADLAIGSNEPIVLDLVETAKRFDAPPARRALAEAGFNTAVDVARVFVATREEIEQFVGPGPHLSDDQPLIEYYRSMPGRGLSGAPNTGVFSRDASKILARR